MIKFQPVVRKSTNFKERHMSKSTLFLLGVVAGAAIPLILKAAKPLHAYAVAGGLLAYEAACDATEDAREAISASAKKIRAAMKSTSDS
jgi:hypothetical protein